MEPTVIRVFYTDNPNSIVDVAYINAAILKEDIISLQVLQDDQMSGFSVRLFTTRSTEYGTAIAHFTRISAAMEFCEKLQRFLGFKIIDLDELKNDASPLIR